MESTSQAMNEHLPASMNSKQNWEKRNMILTPILDEHGGLLDLQNAHNPGVYMGTCRRIGYGFWRFSILK